jgi:hypothetical protein
MVTNNSNFMGPINGNMTWRATLDLIHLDVLEGLEASWIVTPFTHDGWPWQI